MKKFKFIMLLAVLMIAGCGTLTASTVEESSMVGDFFNDFAAALGLEVGGDFLGTIASFFRWAIGFPILLFAIGVVWFDFIKRRRADNNQAYNYHIISTVVLVVLFLVSSIVFVVIILVAALVYFLIQSPTFLISFLKKLKIDKYFLILSLKRNEQVLVFDREDEDNDSVISIDTPGIHILWNLFGRLEVMPYNLLGDDMTSRIATQRVSLIIPKIVGDGASYSIEAINTKFSCIINTDNLIKLWDHYDKKTGTPGTLLEDVEKFFSQLLAMKIIDDDKKGLPFPQITSGGFKTTAGMKLVGFHVLKKAEKNETKYVEMVEKFFSEAGGVYAQLEQVEIELGDVRLTEASERTRDENNKALNKTVSRASGVIDASENIKGIKDEKLLAGVLGNLALPDNTETSKNKVDVKAKE